MDGVALCKIVARIKESNISDRMTPVPKTKKDAQANFDLFLKGCRALGLEARCDLFSFYDLRKKKHDVIMRTLQALARELDGAFWDKMRTLSDDSASDTDQDEQPDGPVTLIVRTNRPRPVSQGVQTSDEEREGNGNENVRRRASSSASGDKPKGRQRPVREETIVRRRRHTVMGRRNGKPVSMVESTFTKSKVVSRGGTKETTTSTRRLQDTELDSVSDLSSVRSVSDDEADDDKNPRRRLVADNAEFSEPEHEQELDRSTRPVAKRATPRASTKLASTLPSGGVSRKPSANLRIQQVTVPTQQRRRPPAVDTKVGRKRVSNGTPAPIKGVLKKGARLRERVDSEVSVESTSSFASSASSASSEHSASSSSLSTSQVNDEEQEEQVVVAEEKKKASPEAEPVSVVVEEDDDASSDTAVSLVMGVIGLGMMAVTGTGTVVFAELLGILNLGVAEGIGILEPEPQPWPFKLAARAARCAQAHSRGVMRPRQLSSAASSGGGGGSDATPARGGAAGPNGDGGDAEAATTHFGFKNVDVADKEELVGKVFHSVAEQYDVMNDLMSGTLHRVWKDDFVKTLLPLSVAGHGGKTIDVAGGTGDIAFRIVQQSGAMSPSEPPVHVTVCDINSSMLKVGEKRAQKLGLPASQLDFVQGNAESLPQFEDNTFDAYTIAFGIRNVTHIDKALEEAHRILKPGGRFMCLEFSHVANPVIKTIYEQYSFHVIPVVGQLVANDRDSYQYLVESIRKFPTQRKFERMIRDAGFSNVSHVDYTAGIVAVHTGFKL
ncbi:4-benzoquinol methylase) (Demethylmenaquinone methyltransferase) [Durusdinium trenchii]|uniref:2-methoxy-6-polyprenyl-1,4-benzoquinol methylase, mitochondrial n=1 Tax=Durusdinium trenchii TaxID=1381693 RepID=A0ABP0KCT7_9DINO